MKEIKIKKAWLLTIFIFVVFITVVSHSLYVHAEDPTPTQTPTPTPGASSEKLNQLQTDIADLQKKVNELQSEGKTLSSQIAVMDNQIKLTELRMDATTTELEELEEDIATTSDKIVKLEGSLENLTKVLLNRIVATYQIGSISPIEVMLTSGDAQDFFVRANYLRIAQAHDKRLIFETQQARNDYSNQKEIFEKKKEKVVVLKQQLEDYTVQLDADKKNKETLLAVTKNSEKEYQKRLADALRELSQIQKAAQVLISTEPRKVTKGEPIGLMGNTGYSFGAHLHFGLYNISSLEQYDYYSNHENPSSVLESKSVTWNTSCPEDPSGGSNTGSGSFAWPMSTDSLRISQNYGVTCYSNIYYKGRPHPAYDMYNNADIVVRATDEGQAYICRNCTGDGANGVFLFHPNGKMTLYWHLQ